MSSHRFTAALGCAVIIFALSAPPPCAADELTDITALSQQGSQAKALERVEAYLAANPRDTRGRFLKGVILTELGKTTEAIRMFSMLTQDFPDLPEPYNNLAVLYALQGDYDRARTALETAIRKNPAYATAYENLGDLHAKLANRAYEKARELDKSNTSATAKIDAIRGMLKTVPAATRTAEAAQRPVAAKPAVAEPATVAKAEMAAQQPAVKAATSAAQGSPASAKPAAEAPKPPAAPASTPPASGASGEVLAALNEWARAWSSKDANAYLAAYAPDFKVPGNQPRAKWEELRRTRLAKPKSIEVSLGTPTVGMRGADRAIVSFRQRYRTEAIDESDNKQIVLAKEGGKWLIVEERVVK